MKRMETLYGIKKKQHVPGKSKPRLREQDQALTSEDLAQKDLD